MSLALSKVTATPSPPHWSLGAHLHDTEMALNWFQSIDDWQRPWHGGEVVLHGAHIDQRVNVDQEDLRRKAQIKSALTCVSLKILLFVYLLRPKAYLRRLEQVCVFTEQIQYL